MTKLDLGTPHAWHLNAHAHQLDASTCNMERELAVDGCNRGHHVFKNIWTPTMGEHLPCKRKIGNNKDWYVVAVL